jgi:hypothetical protein
VILEALEPLGLMLGLIFGPLIPWIIVELRRDRD